MLRRFLSQGLIVSTSFCCAVTMSGQMMHLVRNSSLTGHISDENGKPMTANVVVYERNIVDGRRDLAGMCSAPSDTEGRYRCGHLPAGDYLISVSPQVPTGAQTVRVRSLVYGLTFYPSTTDPKAATLVTIGTGEAATADIALRAHPAASFRGHLAGSFMKSSVKVFMHSGNLTLPAQATINYDPKKGEIVITNLAEGSYRIEADGFTEGGMQHMVAEAPARAGTEQQIQFIPTAYHDVKGTVQMADKCDHCVPTQIELRRIDAESNWHVVVPVDEAGSFTVRQVVDGDYVIDVAAPKTAYVAEIDLGGRALSNPVLHLTSDFSGGQLQLKLDPTKAGVSGMLDSSRVTAGKSGVVLQNTTTGAIDVERVDARGQFHYDGLGPGDYRLFAWRNLDKAEYRSRDYLAGLSKKASSVSIDDADTRVANLDVQMIE